MELVSKPEPLSGKIKAFLRQNRGWTATLIALSLMLLIFPDVLFFGRSIQPSALGNIQHQQLKREIAPFFNPRAPGPLPSDYFDMGASLLQAEPSIGFMRFCITKKQSPFWNPYSATGSVGPEILGDNKFAPLTILAALAGDNAWAFSFSVILIFACGTWCAIRVVQTLTPLSPLAVAASAVAYVLTGFVMTTLNSAVGQAYFFAPIVTLGATAFWNKPGILRYIVTTLAIVLLILNTVLPTTLCACIAAAALIGGHVLATWKIHENRVQRLLLLSSIPLVALALCAPVALPIWYSFSTVSLLEVYEKRIFPPFNMQLFGLSIFTPHHFWTVFNRTPLTLFDGTTHVKSFREYSIFYIGIILSSFVFAGLGEAFRRRSAFLICAALVVVSGSWIQYSLPGGDALLKLPILHNIQQVYWGSATFSALFIVAGFGFQSYLDHEKTIWLGLLPTAIAGFFLLSIPRQVQVAAFPWGVLFFILVFPVFLVLDQFAAFRKRSGILAVILLVTGTFELLSYVNWHRPYRLPPPPSYSAFIHFVRAHLQYNRVADLVGGFKPEWGSHWQIPQVETINTSQLPWYQAFFLDHFKSRNEMFLLLQFNSRTPGEWKLFDEALDQLCVKYVFVGKKSTELLEALQNLGYRKTRKNSPYIVLENTGFLPRAYLTEAILEAPGNPIDLHLSARAIALSEDRTFVQKAHDDGISSDPQSPVEERAAVISKMKNTSVTVQVKSPGPAILVLCDSWHPGWHGWVNGVEQPVARIDQIHRGVIVPGGKSEVIFRYQPPGFALGCKIAFATITLALVSVAFILYRRRRFPI